MRLGIMKYYCISLLGFSYDDAVVNKTLVINNYIFIIENKNIIKNLLRTTYPKLSSITTQKL